MRILSPLLLGLWSALALAQADYPSRPVRIVVPFPPGGATDVVTRVIAQDWSKRFPQPAVVENRPGANGILGTAATAKAAPDGYTLVMGGVNTNSMNDALYPDLPYRSDRDFAPISLTARIGIVIVANPKLGIRTLSALLQEARARPGILAYGSSGMGGPHHLAMELLKTATHVDLTHVPYNGATPALNDLLASSEVGEQRRDEAGGAGDQEPHGIVVTRARAQTTSCWVAVISRSSGPVSRASKFPIGSRCLPPLKLLPRSSSVSLTKRTRR